MSGTDFLEGDFFFDSFNDSPLPDFDAVTFYIESTFFYVANTFYSIFDIFFWIIKRLDSILYCNCDI